MSDVAQGRLHGNLVIIDEEGSASQVYNKGYFGTPASGGGLDLPLIDAVYLLESGRLSVNRNGRGIDAEGLISYAIRKEPGFEVKYVVYRDMRQRGYVVKQSQEPIDFLVLPRGGAPRRDPSKYWLVAISERRTFSMREVEAWIGIARNARKALLLGVVDEEGDLTYYTAEDWTRKRAQGKAPKGHFHGVFLGDRTMVFDREEATRLHASGFYGKEQGVGLQLSLLETAYLMGRGSMDVRDGKTGRRIAETTFTSRARKRQGDFDLRMRVYDDMKGRGMIVKTGFKYGVHFRMYDGDPDEVHARYLVHAVPGDWTGTWPDVSRAVRLAHGVKKDMIFAEAGEEVRYLRLRRVRP